MRLICFRCCSCEDGVVYPTKAEGRSFDVYLGKPPLIIPDWVEINTCNKCGEWYFKEGDAEALEELWHKQEKTLHTAIGLPY